MDKLKYKMNRKNIDLNFMSQNGNNFNSYNNLLSGGPLTNGFSSTTSSSKL